MALPEQTITIPETSPTALSGDALVQAATTPAVRPDFSDPFNARTAIAERIGLTAAQTAENEIANRLRTFQTQAQKEQQAIQGNRDLSLGLAQGFQRQSAQTASLAERGILDELSLSRNQRLVLEQQAADEFSTFQQELGERRSLVAQALQFGDKGVDVNMSIDELTSRVAKSGQEYTEKKKKEAYKEDLKAQLRALGKSTSGSKNELEKRLKKFNKEALAEAKSRSDQEWAMKVADFNLGQANTKSIINERGKTEDTDIDAITGYAQIALAQGGLSQIPEKYRDDVVKVMTPEQRAILTTREQGEDGPMFQDTDEMTKSWRNLWGLLK